MNLGDIFSRFGTTPECDELREMNGQNCYTNITFSVALFVKSEDRKKYHSIPSGWWNNTAGWSSIIHDRFCRSVPTPWWCSQHTAYVHSDTCSLSYIKDGMSLRTNGQGHQNTLQLLCCCDSKKLWKVVRCTVRCACISYRIHRPHTTWCRSVWRTCAKVLASFSAGLMPTMARGNFFTRGPSNLLTRDKDLGLSKLWMHVYGIALISLRLFTRDDASIPVIRACSASVHRTCVITITSVYDYQHNTTISVQQFTFTTTVACHSLGLDQDQEVQAVRLI